MMPRVLRAVCVALLALVGASCALPRLMRRTTDAARQSSAVVQANTEAVLAATRATNGLLPALEKMERLEGPLGAVADLDPTLRSVSDLRAPMTAVGALALSMRSVAELNDPLTRVASLRVSLDSAAHLAGPLAGVAALGTTLESVAELRDALDRVASLQGTLASMAELRVPLEQVGQLKEPMQRVAQLSDVLAPALGLMQRPGLLVFCAILILFMWGLVTFIAVRLALIQSTERSR